MDLRAYEISGNVLVKIRGRIVLDECDRLKTVIVSLINPSVTQVNVDLSEVEFIDSAGLGALVGIKVSANKHRSRLTLISPSRGVSDILMVSKLDSLFEVITGPDAEQLVSQLNQPMYEKTINGSGAQASGRIPQGPSMQSPGQGVSSFPGPAAPDAQDNAKQHVDQLCKEAVEHMRRGDYESAAVSYEQAIEINPEYLPANNNLAIVFEKRPHWHDKAVEQWRRVLEISTKNSDQKHIDRAQKHLNNLERLGPPSSS